MTAEINKRLVIDPLNKTIEPKYRNQKLLYVAKGDRDSVIIGFEIPRYVDGYDMSADENVIHIHYANMDKEDEAKISRGFSDAIEVKTEEDEATGEERVSFCWLVPKSATRYAGVVSVGVTFERYDNVDGETQEIYSWSIAPYGEIVVRDSMDNSAETIQREYDYLVDTCNKIVEEALRTPLAQIKENAESVLKEAKEHSYSKEESDGRYATPEHITQKISVYDETKKGKCANALKSTVKGRNALVIADTSDLNHDVKVTVSSINIPLGIGSVSFARRAGEHFAIIEPLTTVTLSAGTYTLNVKGTCDAGAVGVTLKGDSCYVEAFFGEAESSASDTFTITKDTEVTISSFGNGLYSADGEAIECYGTITPTLSKGTKVYPDVETDSIALSVYGKNLFNVFSSDLVNGSNYGDFHNCVLLEDGSVKLDVWDNYYASIKTTQFNKLFKYFDGQKITLSCKEMPSDYYMNIVIYYDGATVELPWTTGSRVYGRNYCTLTLNHQGRNIKCVELRIAYRSSPYKDTTTILYDLQLKLGNMATEYCPYVEPTKQDVMLGETIVIPPLSDMTIISDTNGVEIEVTYNRDINQAYAKQQAEIDELRAMILELTTN